MIDLGDVHSTSFEVRNTAGALTTPASNVCTILLPDGTTATPTLTAPSTGVLRLDYPTLHEGWHRGRVVTVNPDSSQPFDFHVGPAYGNGIVSLADVRAHLNMTATTNDEELRGFIDAATDFIESRVGPVVRRTITTTVTPGSDGRLYLDGPVISLTTITDAYGYGQVYDVANYVGGAAGVVRGVTYSYTISHPVTVTYVGGRVIVPTLIRQAALDYVKWMWESQRGASPLAVAGGEFEVTAPATVPFKIMQALEPYQTAVVA